jgi:hypothetical protein
MTFTRFEGVAALKVFCPRLFCPMGPKPFENYLFYIATPELSHGLTAYDTIIFHTRRPTAQLPKADARNARNGFLPTANNTARPSARSSLAFKVDRQEGNIVLLVFALGMF